MKEHRTKILIVGLFLSEKNKTQILRTAADQLAELLSKNSYKIIRVSTVVNKWLRFIDTMQVILFRASEYKIAIVPLYGGNMSLFWAKASIGLLKSLGKKVILIVHGGSIPEGLKKNASKYLGPIKKADVVVCPSGFILQSLKHYDINAELIENVVRLGDYSFHTKQTFRPRLFWMRTLEDIYNPEMAVRITGLLAKKYPDIKMIMAGYDKGSLKLVQDLSRQLNVADKIELPGYISNEEKNNFANDYDIYICTNRIDNAPVSFIEMMALGLPVVSVNVGGIPYLLQDGYNGLLVDLDDDVAMVDKISLLVEQPEVAMKLAENGRLYAQKFDEAPVLNKWKGLLNKMNYN